MSDCVYVAWSQAVRDIGIEPKEGSRAFFDLARSLFGESSGLWSGAAPVVLGLLCRMHGITLSVHCHPWFNKTYYRAAATSLWQSWIVDLWRRRSFWRELTTCNPDVYEACPGSIYFWLGGHHAYYAKKPIPGHFIIMRIKLYRRQEGK